MTRLVNYSRDSSSLCTTGGTILPKIVRSPFSLIAVRSFSLFCTIDFVKSRERETTSYWFMLFQESQHTAIERTSLSKITRSIDRINHPCVGRLIINNSCLFIDNIMRWIGLMNGFNNGLSYLYVRLSNNLVI